MHTILRRFQVLSGLMANDGKSLMFCANMSHVEAKDLTTFSEFMLAFRAICYLGLLLISRRLLYVCLCWNK